MAQQMHKVPNINVLFFQYSEGIPTYQPAAASQHLLSFPPLQDSLSYRRSLPKKMDGWKTIVFSFWDTILSGAMLVSGRICIFGCFVLPLETYPKILYSETNDGTQTF